MKTVFSKYAAVLILVWVIIACSTEKTGFMNKGFHATNTKYNILYNGTASYDRGVQELKKKYVDDFSNVITVEPTQRDEKALIVTGAVEKSPHFQRAEEKAVKASQKHSMYVAGKEHNPQIDEAYMLLGKARYQDLRFVPAIEAFNYIILKYPDSDLFYDALIWKEKTNLKLEYDGMAIQNIKKILRDNDTKLKDQTKADAYATLAQGYINLSHLDSARMPLKQAIDFTSNTDEKARYTYILGQLNSKTGQKSEAVKNFQDVIDYNRRISRALVINAHAEKFANQDINAIDTTAFVKQYLSLLNDRENRAYSDIIFHQLGVMHEAYKLDDKAIKDYNMSLKVNKNNEYIKVANYNKLANIYYQKKQFETAGMYYDSTMVYMNPMSREYVQVKRKRNNLVDIVRYEQLAKRNDSILNLASMDDTQRKAEIQKLIDQLKQDDLRSQQASSQQTTSNGMAPSVGSSSNFYFYNTNTVLQGKTDFSKKWGNRQLTDNWRWAEVAASSNNASVVSNNQQQAPDSSANDTASIDDPNVARYNVDFYIKQIPTDEEELKRLKLDRDNAYYQLGLLYSDRLEEYEVAAGKLEHLLATNPEQGLIEPAKYHLYKIYLKINPAKAQAMLEDLKTNHPNSRYTQVALNPNAVISGEGSPTDEYNKVYRLYANGAYYETLQELDAKIPTIIGDGIVSKFELLKAMTIGKLRGLTHYKEALEFVALTYPTSKEGKEAERIITKDLPKLQGLSFKRDLSKNIKMVYAIPYPLNEEGIALKTKLEQYANDRRHTGMVFSADMYNDNTIFFVLHGVKSGNIAKSAQMYLELDKEYGIKQSPVLISTDDYGVVLIKKNWDEYVNTQQ
ncbi:tetratricopeptide repeat protein [Flavobacterium sp. xlx-214]|uniref:type IX secretion system periplasmic lipoprotein PorW/SprE n=1 Tax=unclassified Flavobacterium TaxID=196869 RepID=UPI0013D32874|nr:MULTISPECIES: tetratricopeptide repeat protein [unclassified Flavobacterium]MBA5792019.1 tetratricopeptide repeat protein [Flavobacterium sp. xlx-221]QMI84273.1 tetratricopeptide repeat protein [Flavobacterium sp. xlx-214]